MTSTERLLLEHHPHHLMRKSQKDHPIFSGAEDYRFCLRQIELLRQEYQLQLHAWCLLPDRVHVLVTAEKSKEHLSMFMKALTCRSSLRNRSIHGKSLPWDPRFRSSPVEPGNWMLATMCYIERLPALKGFASSAYQHEYSSYRMRLGKTEQYWLADPEEYQRLGKDVHERAQAYRLYMKEGLDANEIHTIETSLQRNRLTGSQRFVEEVYKRYGVLALNRGPGRPRKTASPAECHPGDADRPPPSGSNGKHKHGINSEREY